MSITAAKPDRKPRRAYGSVRPLLLESARKVFAERGFAGATTREIAEHAGATERLLFHHFGSKLRLFQASVLEPFTALVDELTTGLSRGERAHGEPLPMRDIVAQLYATLRDNRDLSMAVAIAHEQGFDGDDDSVLDRIRPTMTTIWRFVAAEAEAGGWRPADMAVVVGNVMGMITAAAVFKDYFFVHHPGADDETVIDELTDLIVNGLMRRHDQTVQARVDHHPGRVLITGPDPVVVAAAFADWTARRGPAASIGDVSWHRTPSGATQMRIYPDIAQEDQEAATDVH